jgi:hypothetical protein
MNRCRAVTIWWGRAMKADWQDDLEGWLAPFLAVMEHRKRRLWAPVYPQGLIGSGERKSLQPTAAKLGLETVFK